MSALDRDDQDVGVPVFILFSIGNVFQHAFPERMIQLWEKTGNIAVATADFEDNLRFIKKSGSTDQRL